MMFFGPVLRGWAFRRARNEPGIAGRVICLLSAMVLLSAVPIAVDGLWHPCTSSNAHSFTTGLFGLLAAPGWTVSWTALWLL